MIRANYIFLIFISFFLSCEKKLSDKEFEQDVFDNLFIEIVDSTYTDLRIYTSIPKPGKPIYDKRGKWIGFDTIGKHQRNLENEAKVSALEKDTLDLIIALNNEGLINEKTDLNKYKNPKFVFKHLSENPRSSDLEYSDWKKKYKKFVGVMSFSNIKFDAKKQTGTIDVKYSCGGKCGLGYRVSIKKINYNWIISKVEQTSIS